jgi:hypothetical protein
MTPDQLDDRALRDRLRSLRVDPADRDRFGASLRQRLAAAGPPEDPSRLRWLASSRMRRSVLWPVAGLAAGIAVALGIAFSRTGLERPAHVTVLPATKVAVVRLNLSTDVAVEGAHVRVELPPELSFWADGAELPHRSFEWTQPLEAGDNEIPIAVRGREAGRYRVVVKARIGDQVVREDVLLEVVEG